MNNKQKKGFKNIQKYQIMYNNNNKNSKFNKNYYQFFNIYKKYQRI